jgi:hypothetical protein
MMPPDATKQFEDDVLNGLIGGDEEAPEEVEDVPEDEEEEEKA